MFGDRTIDIYGDAAITSATVTFDGYSDINQDSYANYSLTWTSTSTKVVILTAGHLAQSCTSAWCCGYGFGCGAGNITGACHFKLSNLDNNSLGNQDNQLHFIGQFPTVIAPEDVEIYISSEFPLCNTSVTFYLNYYNQGTVPASGRIEYEIDPLVTYNSATPSPDSISGNFLIWYYSNLATNQSPLITLNLTLPGAGDTIVNTATIIAIDSLENLVDSSSYNYTRIIGCSYDPNDKTVNPQGETEHHYTPMDSQLDYTIRFQNTGTAPATRVEIIDTLSNPLDLNSLRIISSSHLMSFYVNGKTIHFVFDNINLPDSNTNEQASHGYVFYRVKPEENLSELTTVKNTAHIFFDLNAAVATNTTQNIFTSFPASTICTSGNGNIQKVRICHNNKTLCVDANAVTPHLAHGDYVGSCTSNREQTFEGDNADLENVYVFPNPTSGLFTLKFSGAISKDISLRITNVIGEIIYQQNSVSENYLVNLSHIPDGLYFISLRIDGKLIQKKITLTR